MKRLKLFVVIGMILLLFNSCKNNNTENISETVSSNIYDNVETTKFVVVDDDTIRVDSFSFDIPEDFTLLSNTDNPILESSDGKFQIMIEDKTNTESDYENHIDKTFSLYQSMGINPTQKEKVSIGDFSAKRFAMTVPNEEGKNITMIFYFIEQSKLKIDAVVMLKDEQQNDLEEVDNFVASIDFLKQ